MACCMSLYGAASGPGVYKIDTETGKGTITCDSDGGFSENCPSRLADYPVAMYIVPSTEDGALYEGKAFVYGDLYNFASARQGKADLILDGVANQFVDRYASMIYDEATGYLLLSAHTKGSGNQLYAIDPATQLATLLGDFGEGVQPVVSLYQYDRYTDVPMNIWYHEAVDFVTKCGIMEGVGDGKFWPDGVTTRGQLVTVLYRMAGMPAVEDECGFTDVPADSWYHDAVVWAYVSGITTGITDTLFAPSSHVTREQVVTFLCRYAGFTGMDTTATGDLSAYADADLVSDYALPAMSWAVEQGIITGMGEDTLSPGASSTRAQIATMLMRFLTLGE